MAISSGNDIDIKVKIDSNDAVRQFNTLDSSLKKLENQVHSSSNTWTELNQKIELAQKAFRLVVGTANEVFDAIERGSAVDDVSQAFDRLSQSAGTTSKTFLNDLQRATAGTISNFELLTKANEALRAGLSPDQFTQITQAARVLAEDGIGNLTQNIQELAGAYTTGRTMALKYYGIVIDQDEAVRKFTGGLAQNASQVNEQGRLLAIQNQISEEYNRIAAESARLTEDAGDKIGQLKAALENAKDQFFQAAANNAELNRALSDLINWIGQVDFQRIITQLTQVIELMLQVGGIVGSVASEGAAQIDSWADSIVEWAYSFTETGQQLDELKKKVGENVDILKTGETTTRAVTEIQKEQARTTQAVGQAHKSTSRDIRSYLDQTKQSTKEVKSAYEAQVELAQKAKQAIEAFKTGTVSTSAFREQMQKLKTSLDSTQGGLEEAGRIINSSFDSALSDVSDDLAEATEKANEFAFSLEDLGNMSLDSLFSGLGQALSGDWQGAIGSVFSDLGSSFGAATGIPGLDQLGAAIGQKVADAIVGGIESVLGGRDAQGAVRDSMDALFAGWLEGNPFQQIINGALQSIDDLEFGRGTDAYNTGTFDDLLLSLDQDIQRGFQAAGLAFSTFVEGGTELAGQLAAVLSNNVGGSLNNLQVLIEATGQSLDTLRDNIIQTFLDGEITITQAAEALLGLQQLAEGGIPDAIGDVAQAFNNLQIALADGAKGGRYTVDAIKDIAAEAQELGIKDLPALANALVNTFGFSAEQVAAFFTALEVAGIQTLNDLANASAATAIAIGANLEAIENGQQPVFQGDVAASTPSYSPSGGSGSGGGSSVASANSVKRNRQQTRKELDRLVEGTQDYKAAITSLNAGLIDNSQAFNIINSLYDKGRALREQLTKAEKAFNKEISEKTTKNLLEARKALEEFTGAGSPKNATINEGLLAFARKFSDNIDLINVAAQRAGISFAQLKDNAIQAFLAGKSSIAEAVNAINDAGPGIAGKTGAVSDAFSNLRQYGSRGGALSVDAVRDIAAEAIELGGKNLDELLSAATAQGVDPSQLQDLISVLQAQGISTLQQLVSANDETVIRILGGLQELAFPFETTSDAVLQLLDDLNKIPDSKQVDLVLNLKTGAIDSRLANLLESIGIDIPEILPGYGDQNDSPGVSRGGKKKKGKRGKRR